MLIFTKATSVRGDTLTAAHLPFGPFGPLLACMAKFKLEPKCDGVKETPLAEVALQGNTSLTLRISRKRFLFNRTRFPIQLTDKGCSVFNCHFQKSHYKLKFVSGKRILSNLKIYEIATGR